MRWRNIPYWLKGGIISTPIGILLFILANTIWKYNYNLLRYLYVILLIILSGGLEGGTSPLGKYPTLFIVWFIFVLIFFGIGALIGLIIQKIKEKK